MKNIKNRITVTITEKNPVHTRLSIWVNGALICTPGIICLRNEEVEDFLQRLSPEAVHDNTK
jgi:hypothetical protein